MKSFKIPYKASDEDRLRLLELRRMQSVVVRVAYNECFEGNSEVKSITDKLRGYENIDLPATMVLYGIMKGKAMYASENARKEDLKKQYERGISEAEERLSKLKKSKSKDRLLKIRKLSRGLSKIKRDLSGLENRRMVFGGRKCFHDLVSGKVSSDAFHKKRLLNLAIFGEKMYHGNRHCRIDMENRTLTIRINRHLDEIVLHLPKNFKNLEDEIERLARESYECRNKFAIEVSDEFVVFSYEEFKNKSDMTPIENRILAFDDNPNYIGISITDWNKDSIRPARIVYKEVVDKSNLVGGNYVVGENSKLRFCPNSSKDKIGYETSIIAKHIVNLTENFRCSRIVKEELNICSSDKKRGRHFNRLCNNDWNREKFSSNLKKRCNEHGIDLVEVLCCNSSKLGNVLYGEDDGSIPDMVASSIELARRSLHYHKSNGRWILNKGERLYPQWDVIKNSLNRWKEEANQSRTVEEFFKRLVGNSYRVKFREIPDAQVRTSLNSVKSKVVLYYLK